MSIIYFIILIFIFYNFNGYTHEYIYVKLHIIESNFLTMLQFFTMFCSFSFISIYNNIQSNKYSKKMISLFIMCGIIQVISKSFVNIASLRLSYSTEIVIRSCKIVPTVLFNIIIFRKFPNILIIASTILMGIGTFGMAITDFKMKNIFSVSGIVYGIIALVLDSIVCNIESMLFDEVKVSEIELILYEYSTGYFILFVYEVMNKDYWYLITRILENYVIIIYVILFCISGTLAVYISLLCTKQHGIITTVMITSSRKLMGIILSFLLFKNKVFYYSHALSILLIIVGSILYILVKANKI